MTITDIKLDKPEAYVLIGFPGSGKSTWAQQQSHNYDIIDVESFIEKLEKRPDGTFMKPTSKNRILAVQLMNERVQHYIQNKKPFFLDCVHLSKENRAKRYKILSSTHKVIFVAFQVPYSICRQRILDRKLKTGKAIANKTMVYLSNVASFPDQTENFDQIIRIVHPKWTGIPQIDLRSSEYELSSM